MEKLFNLYFSLLGERMEKPIQTYPLYHIGEIYQTDVIARI